MKAGELAFRKVFWNLGWAELAASTEGSASY